MARRKMRQGLITFRHPAEVRARRLPVTLLRSARNLDAAKLSRAARAEVELGYVKTSCGEQLVRAIVRKGMVTAVRVDPCSDRRSGRVSPEMKRVLEIARKRLRRPGAPPLRLPMPVSTMLQSRLDLVVTTITCYRICLFGLCIDCCQQPNGDWICGRLTIDTTTGPFIP